MKKQIEDLAIKAGVYSGCTMWTLKESDTFVASHANIEKFAEVMMQECIKALWTDECNASDLAIEEYNRSVNKIKQYFGVK